MVIGGAVDEETEIMEIETPGQEPDPEDWRAAKL